MSRSIFKVVLFLAVLTVIGMVGIRFDRVQSFQNERLPYTQVQIDFRFEDALSDPRACSVTPLGSLTMLGDGAFEFRVGQKKTRGVYNASEVGLYLNQFRKLEHLVKDDPQVSHSTGYQVEVHFEGRRWSGSFDDFRELSSEDLLAAYSSGGVPGLSEVKGNDLIGTFVLKSLTTLSRDERRKISEAMAEPFSKVDLLRLSKVWPVTHWKAVFFNRIEQLGVS